MTDILPPRSHGNGFPLIGSAQVALSFQGSSYTIGLFHDGNQSGHVEKQIRGVDKSINTIQVSLNVIKSEGDYGFLSVGDTFDIANSTGNDGTYTVKALTSTFNEQRTNIQVEENIGSDTVDGTALFGNTNSSGRGDNFLETNDLSDISTEPSTGGYQRQQNVGFGPVFVDSKLEWQVNSTQQVTFNNLADTKGRVDALFAIDTWQAPDDSSPSKHVFFTSYLDRAYRLDDITRLQIPEGTISTRLP